MLALGGFLGFGGAFLVAFRSGGGDISGALLRASIGMIVGALLVKMFISAAHSLHKEAKIEQYRKSMKKSSADTESNNGNSTKS